ncbi:MAG: hypothetical protein ACTSVO_11920 [Candidatus Heimdallarchaeaceae archaeon]
MDIEAFQEYLQDKGIQETEREDLFTELTKFQTYLKNEEIQLELIPKGKIQEYTEKLVREEKSALNIIRVLFSLATYLQKHDYTIELIDIIESYNAMDNLYLRLVEQHGEDIRDRIFENIIIPPIGSDPDKKPEITKKVIKRLEDEIGVEKTSDILSPCLHGRPLEPIKKDREDFLKINNIDEFLKIKKVEFIKRLEKHKEEGTPEYAQYVDEDVIKYVKNNTTMTPGVRRGDKIIITKIPYKMREFLDAEDERMKRYYSCYCAWVRGAIKRGEEREISANFCNCSAGFFKQYWDIVFDQSVKVEPIETPLTGALECKFVVHIPKEFL